MYCLRTLQAGVCSSKWHMAAGLCVEPFIDSCNICFLSSVAVYKLQSLAVVLERADRSVSDTLYPVCSTAAASRHGASCMRLLCETHNVCRMEVSMRFDITKQVRDTSVSSRDLLLSGSLVMYASCDHLMLRRSARDC